jgi:hypothetical protein
MATNNHSIQIEDTSDRISCTLVVFLVGNSWGHAISLLIDLGYGGRHSAMDDASGSCFQ